MQEEKDIPIVYHKDINNSIWLAEEQMRLAAERTFLSWIRTGLTSVGIGIAIAKFLVFRSTVNKSTSKWAGLLLIIWGVGIFLFALLSYRKNYSRLKIFKLDTHPMRPMIAITTILVFITLAMLIIILE